MRCYGAFLAQALQRARPARAGGGDALGAAADLHRRGAQRCDRRGAVAAHRVGPAVRVVDPGPPGGLLGREGHRHEAQPDERGPAGRGAEVAPGGDLVREDIALAASAVVDLLLGPLCFGTGRLDHAPAGVAPGRLRPHLVEADDYAALGWSGVEALEHPLLRANSGSTRAPNQVSSWRHFSPSARRTSLTRLRFMPMPFLPK